MKVALVAGDNALRSSVRMLLSVSGMEVHEFRTAQAFLAAESTSYACLIADCQLSNTATYRMCKEMYRHNRRAPMVVLAASPEALEIQETTLPGIRIVGKPFKGDLLIRIVEQWTRPRQDRGAEDRAPPEICPAVS